MASLSSTDGQLSRITRWVTEHRGSWTKLLRLVTYVCLTISVQVPGIVWGGNEYSRGSDTVRLAVDSRWPGNAHGGYVPIRIKLTNLGPEQDFQFVFAKENASNVERTPEVRRTVRLDQNATREFTLSIPMVSMGNSGDLKVFDRQGQEIEALRTTHVLPAFGGENARASLLVIAADDVDDKALEPFEDAAATECATIRGLSAATGGRHLAGQILESDHLIIPPVSLPENWTDYSGIDLIAISWPNLSSKLKTAEREALLNWAACGGVLIIYGTDKPAAELEPLNQALQLDLTTARHWLKVQAPIVEASITSAKMINSAPTGGVVSHTRVLPPQQSRNGVPPPPNNEAAGPDGTVNRWIAASNVPTYRDWSFGRIYVFPQNPFPGIANDWAWLLSSMPQNQTRWSSRLGMSSRVAGVEFLNFLIPGVGSVPIHAFLILITIFTIVIGPLNYYWLRKTRRLGALVFTVPLIASVACVLLFFYSLVADGFSIRSRVHSMTFLDQQRKSAASLSRLCLYAPFAPSAGLKFSPSVAAFPIWPQLQRFEGGVVDWTGNEQHLTSGWFRSQTWTQFLTVEQRHERGRLDFTPPQGPGAQELTVSNGFSWDLEYLAIEPIPGQWYAGSKIPASASAQLKRLDSNEISLQFSKISKPYAWNLPEGLTDQNAMMRGAMFGRGGGYYGRPPYYGYGFGFGFVGTTALSDGQLRRFQNGSSSVEKSPVLNFQDWRSRSFRNGTERHSDAARPHFWAICGRNPGVEIGVEKTVDRESFHLLFGVL